MTGTVTVVLTDMQLRELRRLLLDHLRSMQAWVTQEPSPVVTYRAGREDMPAVNQLEGALEALERVS